MLHHSHFHHGNHTHQSEPVKCPVPKDLESLSKTGSAHMPMLLVSAACAVLTLISSVSLIFLHLRRYRVPMEQRQIVRIAFAPAVFAIVSVFSILDYRIAPYIDPIGELYEAFTLCGLFLLYIQFVVPGGTFGSEMFAALKAAEEKTTTRNWPRLSWICVFQYPLTEILSIVILEVTEAMNVYCLGSLRPRYGHFWSQVIKSVGVTVCVISIFRFYGRMKGLFKPRRAFSKLTCFKGLVGIKLLQTWVFSILMNHNVIKTSKTFSYGDLLYGLPNALTSVEMVLFSLAFWYAYSSVEYSSDAKPRDKPLSFFAAILNALNPSDLLSGIFHLFTLPFSKDQGSSGVSQGAGMRGKGRYQTIDGMESISQPEYSHGRMNSREMGTAYNPSPYVQQSMYQPPSNSPPDHDASRNHLMTGQREGSRSPSPSRYHGAGYEMEGRNMV